jgi:hypothetical protein
MLFFRFFRKRRNRPSIDHASLIERRAEDFIAFYKERFGYRLNYGSDSLYILDVILSEARNSELSTEWRQWLALHAGAYLFRVASLRFTSWSKQYQWYHPLEQAVMVIGAPDFRISLLAQQAVLQRLDATSELPLPMLFSRLEKAVLAAERGEDELFM